MLYPKYASAWFFVSRLDLLLLNLRMSWKIKIILKHYVLMEKQAKGKIKQTNKNQSKRN